MDAASFVLAEHAVADVREIWEFVAADNPEAADRLLDEFEEAMAHVARRPAIGHKREDLTDANVRFRRVRSYLIVYDPETHPLQILRVLSGFRDLTAPLNGSTWKPERESNPCGRDLQSRASPLGHPAMRVRERGLEPRTAFRPSRS